MVQEPAKDTPEGTDSTYVFQDVVPTVDEYYTLRKEAGLTPPPRDRLDVALKNSIFAVTVRLRDTNQAVAMGRIIGDGGVFVYVTDMATLPQYQRKGLGASIMQRLLARVDAEMPNAFLALSADPPGKKLYHRFGFRAIEKETIMYRSTQAATE